MFIKDRVIGVLEAVNKRGGGQFGEVDGRVLQLLASQAAVAIENARLVEALQKAYDELGKLDKMKSDFVVIASPEVRAPLGVIPGCASFLREESDGEADEYERIVLDSTVHMRKLIEGLTNLRFLEVGDMTSTPGMLDIRDLLQEARTGLVALADAKSQELSIEIPESPVVVEAARSKILVVLTNLLTNAIRFPLDNGHVKFISFMKRNEVWVQVSDYGEGIAPNVIENTFKQFYQVEDRLARKRGGLGLSFVRGTVKIHGGRVRAEIDGRGKGSAFTFALSVAGKDN